MVMHARLLKKTSCKNVISCNRETVESSPSRAFLILCPKVCYNAFLSVFYRGV